jgi:hypothetical protein
MDISQFSVYTNIEKSLVNLDPQHLDHGYLEDSSDWNHRLQDRQKVSSFVRIIIFAFLETDWLLCDRGSSSENKKERQYESTPPPQPDCSPGYPPQYHYGQPPYGQNPYGAPQYPQGYGGNYQGYPPQQYSRGVEDPATNGGSRSMQAFPPPYHHNSAYENRSEKSLARTKNQGSCSQERPN